MRQILITIYVISTTVFELTLVVEFLKESCVMDVTLIMKENFARNIIMNMNLRF